MKTAILYIAGEKRGSLTVPFSAAEDGECIVNWVLEDGDFLKQAVCRYQTEHPELLVLEDSGETRDLAVRLAGRLGGSCIFQVRELWSEELCLLARRGAYNSNLQAVYRLQIPAVVTVTGRGLPGTETLENASGILAGGRGIGGRERYRRLAACATALGAQAGATRPVVMNAWAEMDRLIGQSGRQVSPKWMMTVGASGSGPFVAGVRAERLVAVDTDPNAMIFWNAELGIQADAGAFLDALEKELNRET